MALGPEVVEGAIPSPQTGESSGFTSGRDSCLHPIVVYVMFIARTLRSGPGTCEVLQGRGSHESSCPAVAVEQLPRLTAGFASHVLTTSVRD